MPHPARKRLQPMTLRQKMVSTCLTSLARLGDQLATESVDANDRVPYLELRRNSRNAWSAGCIAHKTIARHRTPRRQLFFQTTSSATVKRESVGMQHDRSWPIGEDSCRRQTRPVALRCCGLGRVTVQRQAPARRPTSVATNPFGVIGSVE